MWNQQLYSATLITILVITYLCPIPVLSAEETNSRLPMEDVQRFSNALSQIKKYYVKPIDDKELFNNAIRGMVGGLDPHSGYLDEEDFKDLQTATSGEFGGLGLEITMEEGVVKVVTPLVDTPAFKAGIKAGDYIIKLGTKAVQGLSLKEAVELMRGEAGSTIDLTILRKGTSKPLHFSLVREKILIKSVKSKLLDGKYGYIRITQFQAMTAEDMEKAIAQFKETTHGNLKGLILDLRNNPGGLLDSAIQVSDAFLGNNKKDQQKKMIVYTQGRVPGSEFTALVTNSSDILQHAPMIVLINNGSASASEIVAGALKDNKRAVILGTQSFGKGSVQTILPLDDKTAIKLTTALYYTPSGISIQAKGITPDIIIDEIQVPKEEMKQDIIDYSEADLSGHLLNNKPSTELSTAQSFKDEQILLHEDYQLYTALTVLKGLALARQ